jgi:hypothetical protein
MIIGSKRIVWMKVIPKQLQQMEITGLTKFSCPTSFRKKMSKVKLKGTTLQCKRVK